MLCTERQIEGFRVQGLGLGFGVQGFRLKGFRRLALDLASHRVILFQGFRSRFAAFGMQVASMVEP